MNDYQQLNTCSWPSTCEKDYWNCPQSLVWLLSNHKTLETQAVPLVGLKMAWDHLAAEVNDETTDSCVKSISFNTGSQFQIHAGALGSHPNSPLSSQFPQYNGKSNSNSSSSLNWEGNWWHPLEPRGHTWTPDCRLAEAWIWNLNHVSSWDPACKQIWHFPWVTLDRYVYCC